MDHRQLYASGFSRLARSESVFVQNNHNWLWHLLNPSNILMILKSFVLFLPALLAGFGCVHLFWKNDHAGALALKVFLGIGLGLGITSCLYFLRLLLLPGQAG